MENVTDIAKKTTVMKIAPCATVPLKLHESLFRSYHVLNRVKHLLKINTPAEVILEMIDLMTPNEVEERFP